MICLKRFLGIISLFVLTSCSATEAEIIGGCLEQYEDCHVTASSQRSVYVRDLLSFDCAHHYGSCLALEQRDVSCADLCEGIEWSDACVYICDHYRAFYYPEG